MAYASIGGLASGMDTASIIQQLMQLEALPQTRLKSRVSTQERQVNALQTLNAKIASIATRATELAQPAKWAPMKGSSTSEHVTVKVADSAQPTSLTFQVNQTARAHQLSFADSAAMADQVTAAGSTSVRLDYLDGTTLDIDTGDGTLQGLVNAVNTADAGVRATTIKLDDGSYRLRVESTTTGEASDFTLTNVDGTAILGGTTNPDGTSRVVAGRDASITVGTDTLTSASNTFTGVTTGVDITLGASTPLATDITVTVERDGKLLTDKVKAMVDGINAALDEIKSLTAYDAATGKGGMLVGDSTLRKIRSDVLSTVTSGFNGASFAEVGIEVDRAGKLVFDEAKFTEAYAADPGAVSDQFSATGGFATKFESLAKQVSDSYEGTLTTSIKSRSSNITRLNNDIENWDTRLALRRTALERQFSGLEVALSNLQNQGNWLAGQLAGLPKWSS
jgi:flagellar hook-associated protein 2